VRLLENHNRINHTTKTRRRCLYPRRPSQRGIAVLTSPWAAEIVDVDVAIAASRGEDVAGRLAALRGVKNGYGLDCRCVSTQRGENLGFACGHVVDSQCLVCGSGHLEELTMLRCFARFPNVPDACHSVST
jgi:hypothetical protein